MSIQESGEMYLENILILSNTKGAVRSVDVSDYMGYSKPSVSRAVGLLKNEGFITVDKEGYITLTASGRERAEKIFERHNILTEVLEMLGVAHEFAVSDACKMEHVISDESFDAVKKALSEMKTKTKAKTKTDTENANEPTDL